MNNEDVKFSAKATEKDVRNYITSLSKGLSKKEKASILDAMREFQ